MMEMINPFGLTKTEVKIFEMGETSGWSMGVRAEKERIIKLLEGYQGLTGMFALERDDLIALIKGENNDGTY